MISEVIRGEAVWCLSYYIENKPIIVIPAKAGIQGRSGTLDSLVKPENDSSIESFLLFVGGATHHDKLLRK